MTCTEDPIHTNATAEYFIHYHSFVSLQVAFDGDNGKVDYPTKVSNQNNDIGYNYRTQPVAKRTSKRNIERFHCVGYDQKEAAEKIKSILIKNQQVLSYALLKLP